MQTRGSLRVAPREQRVDEHIPPARSETMHSCTKPLTPRRRVEIVALDQRLDIKSCPTNDEGYFPCCLMQGNQSPGMRDEIRHTERFLRLQYIDEMMHHRGALLRRRLCAADVKAAVEQHRIARDDVRPEVLCQM